MRAHVSHLQRKFPSIPTEHLHHLIYRNDPFWVRLVTDKRLLNLAKSIAPFLSSADGVALFSSHYFHKKPRSGSAVLWHADGSYWPLRPMNVCTLWVAATHSNRTNGCLRVIRGTHTGDLPALVEDRSVLNVLGSRTHTDEDIARLGWTNRVVDLELEPGDVSLHHPGIIHGSEKNASDGPRTGLTIRYISTATECTDPEQPVLLMEGKAVPGINNYRSYPKFRAGYDMPFKGDGEWNKSRYINPADEGYFRRTDYPQMEKEIERGLEEFIQKLGGR